MAVRQQEMRYVVVGANHRSSAASVRDRLFIVPERAPMFLGRMRDAGLHQAMLLSTCARTEIQAVHADPAEAVRTVKRLFVEQCGIGEDELSPQVYDLEDLAAIRHVFRVTSSLDSPVVGEPQVTGQVKESHRASVAAGMAGPELDSLLQAAYSAAKRVRTETTIGERPVSMAAAGLQLARDVHGDLSRCTGLLILGGEMGELIAEHLVAGGLERMTVVSQVAARAEIAARRFGCHHGPVERLDELMVGTDVVISSVGAGDYMISIDRMEQALRQRRRRPVFLIDAAVPGDIDPKANELEGAFLYDLDDLERVAATGRAGRDAAATEARSIIDEEVASYLRRSASREAGPALAALRAHFETIREAVLEESGGRDVEEVTRRLINRLLHEPSRNLNELAGDGESEESEKTIRRLFGLGNTASGPSEK